MNGDTLLTALALVLLLEGLLPLVAPAFWRHLFQQITALTDGQIRFYGVLSVGAGLLLLLWFS